MCISAVWGGAKLADVLKLVGIPYLTSITQSGGKHVEFVSIDKCKVVSFFPYFFLLLFCTRNIYFAVKFSWLSNIFMFLGGKRRPLQGINSIESGYKPWSWCSTRLWDEWRGNTSLFFSSTIIKYVYFLCFIFYCFVRWYAIGSMLCAASVLH